MGSFFIMFGSCGCRPSICRISLLLSGFIRFIYLEIIPVRPEIGKVNFMSSLDLLAATAGNTDDVIVYRIFGVKKTACLLLRHQKIV